MEICFMVKRKMKQYYLEEDVEGVLDVQRIKLPAM